MYNILLVDDEKLVIKSLQATVNWAKYGFQVAGFALSAQEALEKLEQLKPQVVITDIKMPHTTGLDLLRQIKQRAPDPYCMVISGYAEFEYAQQALSMEAVGYCLKPFDAEEIGRYLERIRQRLDEDWRRDLDHIRLLDAVQSSSEHALQYMDQIYREKAIDFKTDTIFAVFANHLPSLTWLNSPLTFWAGYHKAIGFCSQACLEQFEQQIKLSSDKTSLHVGVSRQICGPEQVAAAIREARRCAYQVFCHQSPGTGLLTRAGTCTDNLVLLVELDRILGQDAVEAQPGQATSANWQALLERLLRRITADFMQNQNSIDYTLRIHHIYNKWLIRHNSEQAGEIADYEAMAEAYPNVYAMLDEIQASYAAWAAAPVSRPV
ncbi:MAG: response regulator, partial [Oscillospiraceae bacterium]|nr:response regulator [Oscillospiraceae bacterium]